MFVTVITVALLVMAGLVIDGGQILNARREAANVAESAARAGVQAVDEDAARRQGVAVVDERRAIDAANAFLHANGYQGSAMATPETVTVTVQIRQPLYILGIGGLSDVTVTGTGTATPLRGIVEANT